MSSLIPLLAPNGLMRKEVNGKPHLPDSYLIKNNKSKKLKLKAPLS